MIFFAPLRLYQGIDKPLNVLTAENTKLIQMQSNSVAGRHPDKVGLSILNSYFWIQASNLLAREDKELLLKIFINVSKADCEMNLYLVRARHCTQLCFLSSVMFKWVTQHVFEEA